MNRLLLLISVILLVSCREPELFKTHSAETETDAYSIVVTHEEDSDTIKSNFRRRPFETIFNVRIWGTTRQLRFSSPKWDTTVDVKDGMRSYNGIIVGIPRTSEGICRIMGDERMIVSFLVSAKKPVFYSITIDSSRKVLVNVSDYFGILD